MNQGIILFQIRMIHIICLMFLLFYFSDSWDFVPWYIENKVAFESTGAYCDVLYLNRTINHFGGVQNKPPFKLLPFVLGTFKQIYVINLLHTWFVSYLAHFFHFAIRSDSFKNKQKEYTFKCFVWIFRLRV